MKNSTYGRRLGTKTLVALSFVLALSGCGGGGGGGGGGASGTNFISTDAQNSVAMNVVEAQADFDRIGTTEPIAGSVTQSTEVVGGSGGNANNTADAIIGTVSGAVSAPRFLLTRDVGADGSATADVTYIDTDDLSDSQVFRGSGAGNATIGSNYYSRDYQYAQIVGASYGSGANASSIYGYVYTDYDTLNESDYVTGGIFVGIPDDPSASDFLMEAFADPSANYGFTQSDILGLENTATYGGVGTAFYSRVNETAGTADISSVYYDVELTANFGTSSALGSVSGTVQNVRETYGNTTYSGMLNLGSANIGSSDSGFFAGDIASGSNIGGVNFSGNWGGQFFGNGATPDGIAGTVGGASTSSVNGVDYTFVGAYITSPPVASAVPASADFTFSGVTDLSGLATQFGRLGDSYGIGYNSGMGATETYGGHGHSTRTEQETIDGQTRNVPADQMFADWTGTSASPVIELDFEYRTDSSPTGFYDTQLTVSNSHANATFADDTTTQPGRTLESASISGLSWDNDFDGTSDGTMDIFVLSDYEGQSGGSDDTNWTSAGVWLYQPTDQAVGDYHMGAFAETQEAYFADITSKTGTATYSGFSVGYLFTSDGSSAGADRFRSDVNLTADFGDASTLGSISGTMTNFEDYAGSNTYTGSINLGPVGLNNLTNSNIASVRRGNLSGTLNGASYSGYWGGQFVANDADNDIAGVAGTVGGSTSDNSSSFTGAYITYE